MKLSSGVLLVVASRRPRGRRAAAVCSGDRSAAGFNGLFGAAVPSRTRARSWISRCLRPSAYDSDLPAGGSRRRRWSSTERPATPPCSRAPPTTHGRAAACRSERLAARSLRYFRPFEDSLHSTRERQPHAPVSASPLDCRDGPPCSSTRRRLTPLRICTTCFRASAPAPKAPLVAPDSAPPAHRTTPSASSNRAPTARR